MAISRAQLPTTTDRKRKKVSKVEKMIRLAESKGLYMYKVAGGYEIDDGNGSTAVCKNLNECEIEIQIMGGK